MKNKNENVFLRCKKQSYLKHRRQNNVWNECKDCSRETLSAFGPSIFGVHSGRLSGSTCSVNLIYLKWSTNFIIRNFSISQMKQLLFTQLVLVAFARKTWTYCLKNDWCWKWFFTFASIIGTFICRFGWLNYDISVFLVFCQLGKYNNRILSNVAIWKGTENFQWSGYIDQISVAKCLFNSWGLKEKKCSEIGSLDPYEIKRTRKIDTFMSYFYSKIIEFSEEDLCCYGIVIGSL